MCQNVFPNCCLLCGNYISSQSLLSLAQYIIWQLTRLNCSWEPFWKGSQTFCWISPKPISCSLFCLEEDMSIFFKKAEATILGMVFDAVGMFSYQRPQ